MDVKARKQELEDLREIARLEAEINELKEKQVYTYEPSDPGLLGDIHDSGRAWMTGYLGRIWGIVWLYWIAFKICLYLAALATIAAIIAIIAMLLNLLLAYLGLPHLSLPPR